MIIVKYTHKFESEVQIMEGSILGISSEQILDFIEKLLGAIKKIFAWLGILILPEDGEYDYPTEAPTEDPAVGA